MEDEEGRTHPRGLSLHRCDNEEQALNMVGGVQDGDGVESQGWPMQACRHWPMQVVRLSAGMPGIRLLAPPRIHSPPTPSSQLFLGDTNRVVAETPLNQASSRSHCVFTLNIAARRVGEPLVRRSKLHFVDLAGECAVLGWAVVPLAVACLHALRLCKEGQLLAPSTAPSPCSAVQLSPGRFPASHTPCAGSERTGKTGLVAHTQLKEAKYINLSLHFLEQVGGGVGCIAWSTLRHAHKPMLRPEAEAHSMQVLQILKPSCPLPLPVPARLQVIISLQEGRGHVPYRNSVLTMVLRDSLGGNCRTVMVAAVAPEAAHVEESISTCRFAQRVAMVSNK